MKNSITVQSIKSTRYLTNKYVILNFYISDLVNNQIKVIEIITKVHLVHNLKVKFFIDVSLVRPDPETRPNPTRTRPRPRFGCTWPKIYTRRVDRVLNSRPGSGSGCPPGRQVLGLACLPTRLYTRLTQFYTRYLHEY